MGIQQNPTFDGLGIAPKILELLDRMKFTTPTPIQLKAIPVAVEGQDVIGVAQTGTGKTLAFVIPVIQRISRTNGYCLVLTPTRELALQVHEVFQEVAPLFGVKTAAIIGGASMYLQLKALKKNPRVLVATPGRLVDHLTRRTVRLSGVDVLILDEADRMLDMGFRPQIEQILRHVPKNRQTMLFSASIPGTVMQIAATHMKLPVHIEVAPSGTAPEQIIQELFIVKRVSKKQLLGKLLKQYHGSVLIFSRTKYGARKITQFLRSIGQRAAEIHSDRSQGQRREALEGFKRGRYRILVATDIASRGIDVVGIELVINFDLPDDSDNYVHRIGRTGRAGHVGRAISLAAPEQGTEIKNIERLIKTSLPVVELPEFPRERLVPDLKKGSGSSPSWRGRGRRRTGGRHSRLRQSKSRW